MNLTTGMRVRMASRPLWGVGTLTTVPTHRGLCGRWWFRVDFGTWSVEVPTEDPAAEFTEAS